MTINSGGEDLAMDLPLRRRLSTEGGAYLAHSRMVGVGNNNLSFMVGILWRSMPRLAKVCYTQFKPYMQFDRLEEKLEHLQTDTLKKEKKIRAKKIECFVLRQIQPQLASPLKEKSKQARP